MEDRKIVTGYNENQLRKAGTLGNGSSVLCLKTRKVRHKSGVGRSKTIAPGKGMIVLCLKSRNIRHTSGMDHSKTGELGIKMKIVGLTNGKLLFDGMKLLAKLDLLLEESTLFRV
jgi:hypothetical protein